MADLPYVSDDTFDSDVLKSSQPVLVEFSAVWCGPCKTLEPIVKQLAQDWSGKVKVVKMDVDSSPNVTMQYQIMSVPTLMLFVSGKPAQRLAGFQPKDKIVSKLSPLI